MAAWYHLERSHFNSMFKVCLKILHRDNQVQTKTVYEFYIFPGSPEQESGVNRKSSFALQPSH